MSNFDDAMSLLGCLNNAAEHCEQNEYTPNTIVTKSLSSIFKELYPKEYSYLSDRERIFLERRCEQYSNVYQVAGYDFTDDIIEILKKDNYGLLLMKTYASDLCIDSFPKRTMLRTVDGSKPKVLFPNLVKFYTEVHGTADYNKLVELQEKEYNRSGLNIVFCGNVKKEVYNCLKKCNLNFEELFDVVKLKGADVIKELYNIFEDRYDISTFIDRRNSAINKSTLLRISEYNQSGWRLCDLWSIIYEAGVYILPVMKKCGSIQWYIDYISNIKDMRYNQSMHHRMKAASKLILAGLYPGDLLSKKINSLCGLENVVKHRMKGELAEDCIKSYGNASDEDITKFYERRVTSYLNKLGGASVCTVSVNSKLDDILKHFVEALSCKERRDTAAWSDGRNLYFK